MVVKDGTKTWSFFEFIAVYGYSKQRNWNIEGAFPTSVCTAFWWIIGGLIGLAFKTFVFSTFVVFLIAVLGVTIIHTISPLIGFQFPNPVAPAIISVVVWIFIGSISTAMYRQTEHYKKVVARKEEKRRERDANKEPATYEEKGDTLFTLIFEYAASFKSKVCPTIRYEANE